MDNHTCELKAYCKLNLTMDILSKRADGYHDISSVMQFIDIYDIVRVKKGKNFSFYCNDSAINNDNNIIVKAYRLLEESYGAGPLEVELLKQAPYMSGMGSASADCAAFIKAANIVLNLKLSQADMLKIGAKLGADVPACIAGGRVLSEGIGEKLTALQNTGRLWFVVIKPDFSFSTPEMYRKIDEQKAYAAGSRAEEMIKVLKTGNIKKIAENFSNGFESVSGCKAQLDEIKLRLISCGAAGASMTGAGSAVFGLYENETEARRAFGVLKKEYSDIWCAGSVYIDF